MKTLLDKFSKLTGFQDIPVSADGTARLAFSGGIYVDLEWPAGNGLHLVSSAVNLGNASASLLAGALRANAPTRTAYQPVLSLQDQDLLVHLVIPENEIREDVLAKAIETVLETVEQWQQIVRDSASAETESAPVSKHDIPTWQMRA